jgi:hypothetical protein
MLVEAVTYRFRGHSMADPEEYRTKEEVAHWRERDPIPTFAEQLRAQGVLAEGELEQIDAHAMERVDAAVEFAEASPFPAPESLYDDVYVLDDEVRGHYSASAAVESATLSAAAAALPAEPRAGDREIPQQLGDALAAGEDGTDLQREAR